MSLVYVIIISDDYGETTDVDCVVDSKEKADRRVKELVSVLKNVTVYSQEMELQ